VLKAVFTDPVSGAIRWSDIEALFIAAGCEVIEGNGSRVRFHLRGNIATFHRPHPEKEARRYQVRDARAFLMQLGLTGEE
jgi:hypothetical protein